MLEDLYSFYPLLLGLVFLNSVAVISPGPDFAIIVKNSLIYSRKTALFTALGISLGILVHVSYTLLGLGLLIRDNAWLLMGLKYAGSGYLFYIGIKGLLAKRRPLTLDASRSSHDISALSALTTGFLTNSLNPKCILFFISLFSAVVSPSMPPFILFLCGAIVFTETLLWFSFVAFSLSTRRLRDKFNACTHWVERTTGGLLMALGAKLFFTV